MLGSGLGSFCCSSISEPLSRLSFQITSEHLRKGINWPQLQGGGVISLGSVLCDSGSLEHTQQLALSCTHSGVEPSSVLDVECPCRLRGLNTWSPASKLFGEVVTRQGSRVLVTDSWEYSILDRFLPVLVVWPRGITLLLMGTKPLSSPTSID